MTVHRVTTNHAEGSTARRRADLTVIVVSHNSAGWLVPCLTSVYANSGSLELDLIVVDSGSNDDTVDVVRRNFPGVRVITSENRGFAAANNRGLKLADADWILFLNPDTRILSGTLAELISTVRARPNVGLAGVRQLDEHGAVDPTMRRFPSTSRSLVASIGGERLLLRSSWSERVLAMDLYERETQCDWTVGSFMLVRREVVDAIGGMDERFFLYCEETDFCRRVRHAGWDIVHFPQMTIFHQSSTTASDHRLNGQMAFARRQYMAKHFSSPHLVAWIATACLGYALRSIKPGRGLEARRRRSAARHALATLLGLRPPPFGYPSSGVATTTEYAQQGAMPRQR